MPLLEVDADAFAQLQAELNAAKPHKALLDKLGKNPKTRAQLLKLMKEDNPDLAIPEIDAAQEVLNAVDARLKPIEDERKADRDRAAKEAKDRDEAAGAEWLDKGRALLRKRGYDKEGIEKIEELMKGRGLPDYEAAAALHEQNEPKDAPIIPSNLNRTWDLFAPPAEDNDIKAAVSLPKGAGQANALKRWQWKEIDNTLKDIRGIGRAA